MIRNSNLEEIDAFIMYARPEPKINESSATLLNGGWFIQTIGEPSEELKMKIICKWNVIKLLLVYATTKELLTVDFLGQERTGFILGIPTYDIGEKDEANPKYIMDFELAVIPDV